MRTRPLRAGVWAAMSVARQASATQAGARPSGEGSRVQGMDEKFPVKKSNFYMNPGKGFLQISKK